MRISRASLTVLSANRNAATANVINHAVVAVDVAVDVAVAVDVVEDVVVAVEAVVAEAVVHIPVATKVVVLVNPQLALQPQAIPMSRAIDVVSSAITDINVTVQSPQ